jgi:hypothetical protein
VRYADIANRTAGPRGADRLHHGFLGAHTFEHGICANSAGEFFDPLDSFISSLRDDLCCPELLRDLLASAVKTVKPGQFVIGSFCVSDNTCPNCNDVRYAKGEPIQANVI